MLMGRAVEKAGLPRISYPIFTKSRHLRVRIRSPTIGIILNITWCCVNRKADHFYFTVADSNNTRDRECRMNLRQGSRRMRDSIFVVVPIPCYWYGTTYRYY